MKNSTIRMIGDLTKDTVKFPFKCIGMSTNVTQPPFNRPSNTVNGTEHAYRVLTLLFDTEDMPFTKVRF